MDDGGLAIARAVHLAATLFVCGALAFRCLAAAPAARAAALAAPVAAALGVRLGAVVWTALGAALLSGAAWLVLLSAEIGDVPPAEAVAEGLPAMVLAGTAFGQAWTARLVVLAVLAAVLATAPRNAAADLACAALGAAFAAGLAFAGHAAGSGDAVHLVSDMLHAVAAGAWLGALVPLVMLLGGVRRAGDAASAALAAEVTRRFSVLGVVSVAALLATGAVNTWEILGADALSAGAAYNRLLFLKIGLFFAMVAIAAFNRTRLMPRLAGDYDHGRALRLLQSTSLAETALGVAIVAIVAVLGRMTPHALP